MAKYYLETVYEAMVLGLEFAKHDERPFDAAGKLLMVFTKAALDETVEALWIIVEHPASTITQICDAWHTIRDLQRYRSRVP